MENKLKAGTLLKAVVVKTQNDDNYSFHVQPGTSNWQCSKIEVFTVDGQMASVPWAEVTCNNGDTVLVNLANVETVTLL